MENRRLGQSSLEVSPITFGCNVFGWTVDEKTSFALLDAWVDAGFNFLHVLGEYAAALHLHPAKCSCVPRHKDPVTVMQVENCGRGHGGMRDLLAGMKRGGHKHADTQQPRIRHLQTDLSGASAGVKNRANIIYATVQHEVGISSQSDIGVFANTDKRQLVLVYVTNDPDLGQIRDRKWSWSGEGLHAWTRKSPPNYVERAHARPHPADRVLARNVRCVPRRRGPKTRRAGELDRDAVGIGHAQARLAELRCWHLVPHAEGHASRHPETDAPRRDREGEVPQGSSLGLDHITLSLKPCRHRVHRGSLVPIDEPMVQDQAL